MSFYEGCLSFISSKHFFNLKSLFIFRERGREGEIGREALIDRLPPTCPQPGTLARNPGMYPDRELNWQLTGIQSTEPHQTSANF